MTELAEVTVESVKKVPSLSPQAKSKQFAEEIAVAEKVLFTRLPEVIDAAIETALSERKERLLMYLIDRCLGRPTERQEISATAEWRGKVEAERDALKEEDPNELLREYQETIGLSA